MNPDQMVTWIEERMKVAHAQHNNFCDFPDEALTEEEFKKTPFAQEALAIIAVIRSAKKMRDSILRLSTGHAEELQLEQGALDFDKATSNF